jgi:hypothetical protein
VLTALPKYIEVSWDTTKCVTQVRKAASNKDEIPGVTTTRFAQVAYKNSIQVVYMHSRLNVSGVLKDLLNKGHS